MSNYSHTGHKYLKNLFHITRATDFSSSIRSIFFLLSFLSLQLGCTHVAQQTPQITPQQSDRQPTTNTGLNHSQSFKNYISLELGYPYYKMLFEKIESYDKKSLKNRGEAHITLITPPEYKVLTEYLTPEQIHSYANEFTKSEPPFKITCLGRSEKNLSTGFNQVYYLVVQSDSFLNFRKELALKAKVPTTRFDPNLFYPHITLGFTERDLHLEDGIIKDFKSCPEDLKMLLKER